MSSDTYDDLFGDDGIEGDQFQPEASTSNSSDSETPKCDASDWFANPVTLPSDPNPSTAPLVCSTEEVPQPVTSTSETPPSGPSEEPQLPYSSGAVQVDSNNRVTVEGYDLNALLSAWSASSAVEKAKGKRKHVEEVPETLPGSTSATSSSDTPASVANDPVNRQVKKVRRITKSSDSPVAQVIPNGSFASLNMPAGTPCNYPYSQSSYVVAANTVAQGRLAPYYAYPSPPVIVNPAYMNMIISPPPIPLGPAYPYPYSALMPVLPAKRSGPSQPVLQKKFPVFRPPPPQIPQEKPVECVKWIVDTPMTFQRRDSDVEANNTQVSTAINSLQLPSPELPPVPIPLPTFTGQNVINTTMPPISTRPPPPLPSRDWTNDNVNGIEQLRCRLHGCKYTTTERREMQYHILKHLPPTYLCPNDNCPSLRCLDPKKNRKWHNRAENLQKHIAESYENKMCLFVTSQMVFNGDGELDREILFCLKYMCCDLFRVEDLRKHWLEHQSHSKSCQSCLFFVRALDLLFNRWIGAMGPDMPPHPKTEARPMDRFLYLPWLDTEPAGDTEQIEPTNAVAVPIEKGKEGADKRGDGLERLAELREALRSVRQYNPASIRAKPDGERILGVLRCWFPYDIELRE